MMINRIMCILKILTDLCSIKRRIMTKNRSARIVWSALLVKISSIKHKDYLSINGVQSAGVEQGIIEFENYFKQIALPFKIYVNFEWNLENTETCEGSYTKNIMIVLLVALLTKLLVLMINLLNQLLSIEVKMQHMNLLK